MKKTASCFAKTAIVLNSKSVYANPTTNRVKVGSKGKAVNIAIAYGEMSKGEARKLRKAFRYAGLTRMAGEMRLDLVHKLVA